MENDGTGDQRGRAAVLRAADSPRACCSPQAEMQSLVGRTPGMLVSQGLTCKAWGISPVCS